MPVDWAQLEESLRAFGGNAHRQAFFLELIRRGRAADEKGQATVAAHCRGRVEAFLIARPDAAPMPPSRAAETESPLRALGARMEQVARLRARELLARHGHRLHFAEREAFAEAISSAQGGGLAAVRRRLHDRLFRTFARRGATLPKRHSDAVVAGAGPYNGRANLDELLRRAETADASWVAEWTGIYRRMERLGKAYRDLLPET